MGKRKIGALEKVEADLYASFTSSITTQVLTFVADQIFSIRFEEILCLSSPTYSIYQANRYYRSYRGDFVTHYSQYESSYAIFTADPSTSDSGSIADLREHIDFVAHVASCYPDITKNFPSELASLITAHHNELEPELREKIVGSLVLLRNKDIIDSITYVLFFLCSYPTILCYDYISSTCTTHSLRVLMKNNYTSIQYEQTPQTYIHGTILRNRANTGTDC